MASLGQLDLVLGADLSGLKKSLGEARFEAEKTARGFNTAFSGGVNGILSDIAKVKASLGSGFADKSQSVALREQSALLQEQIRFKEQLARISAAGLDEKDAATARQLAEELNRVNLDRIAQDAREAKVSLDQLGKSTLSDLKQDLAQSQIALANVGADDKASRLLRQQSSILQEQIRFKKQLAAIDGSGLDEKDAKAARDLANEINRVNLQRIDKEARQAAGGLGFLKASITGVAAGITQELTSRAINGVIGAFRGLTGTVSGSLNTFTQFDGQLTRLSALAGQSRDELQPLTSLIKQLGVETSKSPIEIAAATNELIALGSSAEQATEQLRGVVALSESTGQSLELAGQVVQTTRNIFDEISSDDLADKLATLANTTAVGSLNDTLQLLSKVGAVGKGVGENFDGLAAAFATLRDTGSTAEVAATALKSGLQNITTPTDEAKQKLEELGITTFDASGQFVGFFNVLEQLKGATSGLSEQARSEALGAIFSRGAISSVSTLIQNLDKVDKTYQNLQKSAGAAAESASKLVSSDTLSGASALLEGSLQTLSINFGEALSPFLIAFKDGLTNITNQLIGSQSLFESLRASGEQFAETLRQNPQIISAIADGLKTVISNLQSSVGGALKSLTENLAANPQIIKDFSLEVVSLGRELGKIVELGGKIAGFLLSNAGTVTEIIKSLAILKGTQIAIGVTQGTVSTISSLSTALSGATTAARTAGPAMAGLNAALALPITNVAGLKTAVTGVSASLPALVTGLKGAAVAATATIGPFIALAGAIAAVSLAKRARDLKVERDEVEALAGATDSLAVESLNYASKLKALNQAEEKNGSLTAEQKRQREGLTKLAQEQIAANNAQIQSLQGLETPNTELNNAIQAQIALLEGRNQLLQGQIAAPMPDSSTPTDTSTPPSNGDTGLDEGGSNQVDAADQLQKALDQKGQELIQQQNRINSQLAAGTISREEADKQLTQATIDNANLRYQALTRELATALGVENADKRAEIQAQIESAKSEKLAAEIEKRDRLREQELANIEAANAKTEAAIAQSQNARAIAIKQQQRDGLITVEQAVNQIAAIEQDATRRTIAQKQAELAQIDQLRQKNLISEQEAQSQQLALQGEIGNLRLQQVEAEIAAQDRLREARLRAVQEEFATQSSQIESAIGSNQVESGFVGIQQNLLGAEVSLQQSLNDLANSRLETKIAEAEAAGETTKAEQLRSQLLDQQQEQALALLDLEGQQLELSQFQAQLEAQAKVSQAQLNILKTEQAIIEAQINGASAEQIANLQRQRDIAKDQLDLTKAQRDSLDELQAKERELLDTKREQTLEDQKRQNIAEQERQKEAESSSSGAASGSKGGGFGLVGADVSGFNSALKLFQDAARQFSGRSPEALIEGLLSKLNLVEGRIRSGGSDASQAEGLAAKALQQVFGSDIAGKIFERDTVLEQARRGAMTVDPAVSQLNSGESSGGISELSRKVNELAARPQNVQIMSTNPLGDMNRFLSDQQRRVIRA